MTTKKGQPESFFCLSCFNTKSFSLGCLFRLISRINMFIIQKIYMYNFLYFLPFQLWLLSWLHSEWRPPHSSSNMGLSSGMDQGTGLGPFLASLGPQWWRIKNKTFSATDNLTASIVDPAAFFSSNVELDRYKYVSTQRAIMWQQWQLNRKWNLMFQRFGEYKYIYRRHSFQQMVINLLQRPKKTSDVMTKKYQQV